jgi:hypothetical protein
MRGIRIKQEVGGATQRQDTQLKQYITSCFCFSYVKEARDILIKEIEFSAIS